jgi:hypothetical protein
VKPFGRKVEFAFCRSLRFLLEGVQDHDAVRKPCQIDDPERARAIANPDFANAPAYRLHWPPVIRLKTALDAVKLVASGPPRRRETPEAEQGSHRRILSVSTSLPISKLI